MKELYLYLVGFESKFDEDLFLNWLKAILNSFELFAIARKYGFSNLVETPTGEYSTCERMTILEAENKMKDGIDQQCTLCYCGKDFPRRLFLKEALSSRDNLNQQLDTLDRFTGKLSSSIDKMLSIDVDSDEQQKVLRLAKEYQSILSKMAA